MRRKHHNTHYCYSSQYAWGVSFTPVSKSEGDREDGFWSSEVSGVSSRLEGILH